MFRCRSCGAWGYTREKLCADCWYKEYANGRPIWELWSLLNHTPKKKIRKEVNKIIPGYYEK